VVWEVHTELPVVAAWLPSRRQWAGRWRGAPWRRRQYGPRVSITEGLQAEASLRQGAQPVLGPFQHQQGVTQGLRQPLTTDAESKRRQPVRKPLGQSHEKRTVRRRLARVTEPASAWGIRPWVTTVEEQRPQRIGSVGRVRWPATPTAMARFCRPTRQAPIAVMGPAVRRRPLDRFINDPFKALQERD
jgi:hypothetical protein